MLFTNGPFVLLANRRIFSKTCQIQKIALLANLLGKPQSIMTEEQEAMRIQAKLDKIRQTDDDAEENSTRGT